MTGRLAAVRRDLEALGSGTPVRAAYEVGKRSGAHGLTLRLLAKTARPSPLTVIEEFRPARAVPPAAAARTLEDARLIVEDGHRAFGLRVPVTEPDDWNKLGDTGRRWPGGRYWWQIDIRTDRRIGDVKWTWEIGRHRDLVVLARAAFLEPDARWCGELAQRLRWWFQNSPAERGIHWYSNLEIALRAISWMQIYALCSEQLPRDVLESMSLSVSLSRRHLLVDFPYTVSSMRNNHLLGDALGLLAILRFTGGQAGSRLSRIAEKSFERQLGRHMRADGSMIEDSVCYHRFVMEMLTVKHLLGDHSEATSTALRGSAQHLARLGVLEGEVPQWGDWDEGRVLASSGNALDLAGSTALALVLTGEPAGASWHEDYDEVTWYAPASRPGVVPGLRAAPATASTSVVSSGGMTRVSVGEWNVWFKAGTGPSHQHADLTHVSARVGDQWVLVDPGTGTYNGELEIRNAFRTSRAHNGLRILGEEMFLPHRAFRWLSSGTVQSGMAVKTPDTVLVWAVHDAFSRLGERMRLARAVLVTKDGLTIVDWRESDLSAELTVPLPPSAEPGAGTLRVGVADLVLHGLDDARRTQGSDDPFGGSYSGTYGRWEPALWLEKTVAGPGPSTWGVGMANMDQPEVRASDGQVSIGGTVLSLAFREGGASMTVTQDGTTRLYTAGETV
jgi:hypothetical protein